MGHGKGTLQLLAIWLILGGLVGLKVVLGVLLLLLQALISVDEFRAEVSQGVLKLVHLFRIDGYLLDVKDLIVDVSGG